MPPSEKSIGGIQEKKVTTRDVALFYGQRPQHKDVWHLSPYEFATHWEIQLLYYPLTYTSWSSRQDEFHVDLLDTGVAKLKAQRKGHQEELEPGVDYVVKRGGKSDDWLAFPDVPATQHFRHTWILVRRRRPRAPSFAGAPVPRHRPGEQQRSAAIVMTYFRPWTLRSDDADEHVLYAGNLRASERTWQESLICWLDGGLLCEEQKRYVNNFLAVHRVRPQDDGSDEEANSDDLISDEELQVSNASLADALSTRIGGREQKGGCGCARRRSDRSVAF